MTWPTRRWSTATAGSQSGMFTSTGRPASAGRSPATRLADEIEDRPGLAVYLEHSGLEPGHVQKTGDQAGETVGLDVDEAVQLVGVGIGEGEGAVEQGRGGHLHGRQGCAQVVRHRAEKGTPEAVHLLEQFRAQRLFSQLGSLHGHGGVIGEGSKQGPIGGRRRQAPNGQHARQGGPKRTGPRSGAGRGSGRMSPR